MTPSYGCCKAALHVRRHPSSRKTTSHHPSRAMTSSNCLVTFLQRCRRRVYLDMQRRRPSPRRRPRAPPLALFVLVYLCLRASARDADKLAQDKPAARYQLATRQSQTRLPSLSATRVLNDERVESVRLLRRRHFAVRTLGRTTLLSTVAGSVAACYPGWKQEGLDGVGLGPLCALAVSVASNVLFYLFQRWSLWFKVAMNYRQASIAQDSDAVLVLPKSYRGEAALVPLLHGQSNDAGRETSLTCFSFQHRGYTLTRAGFQPRKPSHTLPITRYLDFGPFEGEGGLEGVSKAIREYGPNNLDVAIPSLLARLMLDESLSPVSVIKALDLLLALADGSPPLLLAMSALQFVAFRLRCAMMVRRNLRKLRSEVVKARGGPPGSLCAFREGEWGKVSAEELAPGDIVYLGPGLKEAPADVLVLSGQAVVDEAILTGESLPQLKRPLPAPAEGAINVPRLDMDGVHRPNVIFSGTRCLRVEASEEEGHGPDLPPDVEVGVVARVLRTGYFSTQGELLRMIDFRSAKVDADSADTLRIFGATGLLSVAAAIGVIVRGSKDGNKSAIQLLLRACILLSRGIPFYLLDMLSDTVAYAVHELNTRHGILCTEPFRIPIAGSVDTCLLDKTGTLTTEHLVLRGVVPAGVKRLPLQPPGQAPIETQRILAACHALVEVDKDDHEQDDGGTSRVNLAGDSLELSALRGVGWSFDGKASVAQPTDGVDGAVHVLRRHPFSSSLQRMSVVVQPLTERSGFFGSRHRQRQIALVKGSPEAMALLLDIRTKPLWYDAVYKQLAMNGTRVLALGWRDGHNLQHADRSDVESNLTFAGFAAFDTSIRADTPEVMASLKAAGMALCVVSGDALLTCVHVAKSVGIISRGKRVAVLEQGADGAIAWWTGDGVKRKRLTSATLRETEAAARKYELCATGPVLKAALDGKKKTRGLGRALHRFRVLARMTPELKERVVRVMRSEGARTVMMCGDGANDVGALKQADVGVALLTGFGSANAEKLHSKGKQEGEEGGAKVTQNEQIRDAFKNALIAELERKKKEEGEPATFGGQLKMFWTVYRKVSKRFFSDELGAASALADDDGTGDTLKLGDASLAAPFTAKSPSVRCVADLIRQGRATQARAQQQAQQGIQYALSALIYRFALSELDARLSRRQLVVLNLFSTIAELGMRDVRPLDDISAARLPSSVFHPASIFSIVGQTLLQTGFTYTLLRMASKTIGVELPAADAHGAELAAEGMVKGDEPSTAAKHLGSLLFLSQLIDRASECIITVKGRPFSTGILDNQTLITTIMALIALPVFAALELDAKFNERLDLTRMGAQTERTRLAGALLLQLFAPIVWDALMLRSFAPAVWTALRSVKMDDGFKKAVMGRMAQGAVLCVMLYKDLLPWDGVVTTLARDPQEDIRALEERAEALLKGIAGAVHSRDGGEGGSKEGGLEGGEAWGVKGQRRGEPAVSDTKADADGWPIGFWESIIEEVPEGEEALLTDIVNTRDDVLDLDEHALA